MGAEPGDGVQFGIADSGWLDARVFLAPIV